MISLRICILFPALAVIPNLALAVVVNVPDDQPTIQAGIYAAAQYDTVLVADGIYTGDGNRDISIINTSIVVKSENGPKTCIINCEGTEPDHHNAFNLGMGSVNTSIIDGFTVTNAWSDYGAIWIGDSTSPTIRNCYIYGNHGVGIYIAWSADIGLPQVDSCTISENSSHGLLLWGDINMSNTLVAYNGGAGLKTVYHPGINLLNCTFVFNDSTGVDLFGDPPKSGIRADSALIRRCISAFNGGYGFDRTFYLPASYFYCNNAYGNIDDDYGAVNASPDDIYGNMSRDPVFCDIAGDDFSIDLTSPCAPDNNSCGILIGAYDIGCTLFTHTWHVNPDGTGDAPNLQGAIDLAYTGDTIIAAAGIYIGEGNRDLNFSGKNIVLVSEAGPEATIINCQGSLPEPHKAMIIENGEDSVVVDGFTITGAYTTDINYDGAIYINNGSPSFRNCIINNNEGNGIQVVPGGSGGNMVTLEGCTIAGNTGDGYGAWGAWSIITRCIINDNGINGVSIEWSGILEMVGTLIFQNDSIGVTGYTIGDDFIVRNCTIFGNHIGLLWWYNFPKNGSPSFDKDLLRGLEVSDNIVAFNDSIGIWAEYCSCNNTCNNSYGNPFGDFVEVDNYHGDIYGNISLDPLFCDTASFNLHIDYNSPCVPTNNDCGVLMGALAPACGDLCGDLNGDDLVNILDVIAMIECIYGIGECPPDENIDVNNDGAENILDITYLIVYIYQGGPPPDCR